MITGASDRAPRRLRKLGLRALQIGSEAVVDAQRFTLEGRSMRKVRQSVARVGRRGWRVEVVDDRESRAVLGRELAAIEADWRAASRGCRLRHDARAGSGGADEDADGLYVLGPRPRWRAAVFLRFASLSRAGSRST